MILGIEMHIPPLLGISLWDQFLLYRYRISLLARWKQRGMYAMCMWVVQLLLVLSNMDSVFIYTPEYYLEALVNKHFPLV
jgi:hypothetical protein